MAAAGVSGGAATVLAANLRLTAGELKNRMLDGADRLSNLTGLVAESRTLNVLDAVDGVSGKPVVDNYPEDDFNVLGYNPTPAEQWELFSGSGQVVQVAAGAYHSLLLKDDGTVWAWGDNYYGQLGDGTTVYSSDIVQVIGLTDVVHISASLNHSLAVKSDGSVWGWGENYSGELGNGDWITADIPAQMLISDAVQAVAGDMFSFVVTDDGTVYGCGYNYTYLLGIPTFGSVSIPEPVPGVTGTVVVDACTWNYRIGLDTQGNAITWGGGNPPEVLSAPGPFISVSAGNGTYYVVKEDGTVWEGVWINTDLALSQIQGISGATEISAGETQAVILCDDGTVWYWDVYNLALTQITEVTDIVDISAGVYSGGLALTSDGSIWGLDAYGAYPIIDASAWDPIDPVVPTVTLDPIADIALGDEITISGASTAPCYKMDAHIVGPDVDIWLGEASYDTYSVNYTPTSAGTYTVTLKSWSYPETDPRSATGEASVSFTVAAGFETIEQAYDLELTAGKTSYLALTSLDFEAPGARVYTVEYDPNKLELLDAGAQGYGIAVLSQQDGEIMFTLSRPEESYSGVLTVLSFRALTGGAAEILVRAE
jgi:alpha-tubulin suppressor-like RCC1 family protein